VEHALLEARIGRPHRQRLPRVQGRILLPDIYKPRQTPVVKLVRRQAGVVELSARPAGPTASPCACARASPTIRRPISSVKVFQYLRHVAISPRCIARSMSRPGADQPRLAHPPLIVKSLRSKPRARSLRTCNPPIPWAPSPRSDLAGELRIHSPIPSLVRHQPHRHRIGPPTAVHPQVSPVHPSRSTHEPLARPTPYPRHPAP